MRDMDELPCAFVTSEPEDGEVSGRHHALVRPQARASQNSGDGSFPL